MSQCKLIKVVHVSDSKVQGREKNDLGGRYLCQQMQRNQNGAKDDLFSNGTSDIVSITLPTAQRLDHFSTTTKISQVMLDEDLLEQGSEVQQKSQCTRLGQIGDLEGPTAKKVERLNGCQFCCHNK